jgi:hypothetical protein
VKKCGDLGKTGLVGRGGKGKDLEGLLWEVIRKIPEEPVVLASGQKEKSIRERKRRVRLCNIDRRIGVCGGQEEIEVVICQVVHVF